MKINTKLINALLLLIPCYASSIYAMEDDVEKALSTIVRDASAENTAVGTDQAVLPGATSDDKEAQMAGTADAGSGDSPASPILPPAPPRNASVSGGCRTAPSPGG